jgi:hypothetical protein
MALEEIPVIICTDDHRLAVVIAGKGQRVLEILNDPGSTYLPIFEVLIQRMSEVTSKNRLPEATIVKSRLAICVLAADLHEAPERRQYAFVEKMKLAATVLVQGWEVQGTISFKGSPDAVSLLQREFGSFFPLTDATIRHATTDQSFSASVAIVNKSLVSVLHVEETRR